ncbi:hypothetical protein Tco_1575809 [Tanacetum coccineum]
MADKAKKSSMETFTPNDKADYYSWITSITVNRKNAYELKGKFLDNLHNNAFSGTNGKDAVEHIEYYLKIIDPIKLPNVDHDKLRVVVFPISLVRGARRWFDGIKESITCWVDLTVNIFGKYYPPSRIEGNNTPKMGGDEIDVSDDESSNLDEYWSDKEETAKIFKIETDIFDYETPLYLAFNEFNYLLKVDPDLLTKDIMGFKTYKDYKDDWIYEWNKNVPWVYDKPWLDNEIWKEPKLRTKYEALRNKAIMEALISDAESGNDVWIKKDGRLIQGGSEQSHVSIPSLRVCMCGLCRPPGILEIRGIRACTHQRPQRKLDQYAVSSEDQYAVLEIWNEYNILEDIKHGPYSKKLQYTESLGYAVSNRLPDPLNTKLKNEF